MQIFLELSVQKESLCVGEQIRKKELQHILLGLEGLVFVWRECSDFVACVRHCCILLSAPMLHLQGLLVMVPGSAVFGVMAEQ